MSKIVHPAQRYEAPSSIQAGVPMKLLMDRKLIVLIAESLSPVVPNFNAKAFVKEATNHLEQFELKERALHIARAMNSQLPTDTVQAATLIKQSLGPCLTQTEGNGLAPFFYLPHSQWVATFGVAHCESGMLLNYDLTQRFTAEFSVRPFLMQYCAPCLKLLRKWTRDGNPHVRRLVSEGTRPRLPWAMRLPEFQANPQLALPLLELLKDDSELYVRRSVANHLGDIAKDHLETVFDICEAWLAELQHESDAQLVKNRHWLIRHAVRHPAKKEHARAKFIRKLAAVKSKQG
jgi:3-methyladenine DNA glycosylase AlkC